MHTQKLALRNVVLFGAPGVGKGVYGSMISKEFKLPVFSMGEYFRKVINEADTTKEDPFVTHLRETLRSGKYVDDQTVIDVLRRIRFETYKNEPVILFDGVPRTIKQAEIMQQEMPVDVVLNFTTPFSVILEKLMGRRVCPCCQRNYNVASIDRDGYFMKPMLPKKSPNHCEDCGDGKSVALIVRDDDKESVIRERMDIYHQKTEPILAFLRASGKTKVLDLDPKRGVDDFPMVRKVVQSELQQL